jgi:excisionase family DNA binding protein
LSSPSPFGRDFPEDLRDLARLASRVYCSQDPNRWIDFVGNLERYSTVFKMHLAQHQSSPLDTKERIVEPQDRLLRIDEAAKRLGVCRKTASALIKDGRLRTLRVGRRGVRVVESSINDLLGRQQSLRFGSDKSSQNQP